MHRLSEIDLESKTGRCEECGEVDIKIARRSTGKIRSVCMERVRVDRRAYRKRVREDEGRAESRRATARRHHIRSKYGLEQEDWDRLLIAQTGRCAICVEPLRDPYVDHSHEDGSVRGLLCPKHNTGLGMFSDSVELLRSAIEYLSGGPFRVSVEISDRR
jgi:hypothetical protein